MVFGGDACLAVYYEEDEGAFIYGDLYLLVDLGVDGVFFWV